MNLEAERRRWSAAPSSYTTPFACDRSFLPKAGDGHALTGAWPPEDIDPEVWSMVDLYLMCGDHHLPQAGGMLDQDARTMAAFLVLRDTDAQIERAKLRAAAEVG